MFAVSMCSIVYCIVTVPVCVMGWAGKQSVKKIDIWNLWPIIQLQLPNDPIILDLDRHSPNHIHDVTKPLMPKLLHCDVTWSVVAEEMFQMRIWDAKKVISSVIMFQCIPYGSRTPFWKSCLVQTLEGDWKYNPFLVLNYCCAPPVSCFQSPTVDENAQAVQRVKGGLKKDQTKVGSQSQLINNTSII